MRLDYASAYTRARTYVRGYILESTPLLIPFIIPDDPFSMPLKIPISARQCCPTRSIERAARRKRRKTFRESQDASP